MQKSKKFETMVTAWWAHIEDFLGCVPHGIEDFDDWSDPDAIKNTSLHQAQVFMKAWLHNERWAIGIDALIAQGMQPNKAVETMLSACYKRLEQGYPWYL